MRLHYDKLIRDRIPEIIEADGKRCRVEVMDDADYVRSLRAKITEEAAEVAEAAGEDVVAEIADLLEVIEAFRASCGVTEDEVEAIRLKRREERGGFQRRLRLLWVEQ